MKKGFTLVELSIVIVIIGFLVAGISAGTKLVEQAKMRKLIRDLQNWKMNYDEFKYIYNAVPGDFDKAAAYFDDCSTGGAGHPVCNGNGDGLIEIDPTPSTGAVVGNEIRRVFRHFNVSGLNISGGKTPLPSGGWSFTSQADSAADAPDMNGMSFNIITVSGAGGIIMHGGGNLTTTLEDSQTVMAIVQYGISPRAGVMSPQKAFQIDQKMDDGVIDGTQFLGSATGNFGATTDLTGGSGCQSAGEYTIATVTDVCALVYKLERQ